jgi:hypothetical protein
MDDYLPNEHDETVLQNRLLKALEAATTSFDTTIGDITQNRLDIPATYNANTERLRLLVNGTDDREFASSGFTDRPGKYQLTAEPGDTLTFGAREPSRYVPSYEFLWGVAAWYDSAPTENSTTARARTSTVPNSPPDRRACSSVRVGSSSTSNPKASGRSIPSRSGASTGPSRGSRDAF